VQYTSCIYLQTRRVAATLALLACAAVSFGADSYSGGELTSPTVVIGAGTYSDVVVVPGTILASRMARPMAVLTATIPPPATCSFRRSPLVARPLRM